MASNANNYKYQPLYGPPGSLITLQGRIFTTIYGSHTDESENGITANIIRYIYHPVNYSLSPFSIKTVSLKQKFLNLTVLISFKILNGK